MDQVVLLVEKNDRLQLAIRKAFTGLSVPTFEVSDPFDAMSSLGRADFGAVVLSAGKRQLSLRGFCQLARKRHPGIHLFVITSHGASKEAIESAVGVDIIAVAPDVTTDKLALQVRDAMVQSAEAKQGASDTMEDETIEEIDASAQLITAQLANAQLATAQLANAKSLLHPPASPGPLVPARKFDAPPDTLPNPAIPGDGFSPSAATPPVATQVPAAISALGDPVSDAAPVNQTLPNPVAPGDVASDALMPAPYAVDFEATLPISVAMPGPDSAPVVPAPISELPTASPPAAPDPVVQPSAPTVLVEGELSDHAGAPLVMSIAAQELTGILAINTGCAQGLLYFTRGEPVWLVHPGGDAEVYTELVQTGKLAPDLAVAPVAEGQLLGSLTASGALSQEAMQKFMLAALRKRVMDLITTDEGEYTFTEEPSFLNVDPLLKINPFGLILESKRRTMTPDQLLSLAGEIEWKYIHPLPALAPSNDAIRPFVRGINASQFMTGHRTVKAFNDRTGLDTLMGTLVMLALIDARLVILGEQAREDSRIVLRESTGVNQVAPG